MKEQEDILKIEVTGKTEAIPVDSFLELVSGTLSVLQDLDVAISQTENATLDWEIVGASLNSPLLLTIEAKSEVNMDVAPEVIRAYLDGIEQIEKGHENPPPYFTESLLRKTREIVAVLNDGIKKVVFSTPSRAPVVPSRTLLENVTIILDAQGSEDDTETVIELHVHSYSRKEEKATITGTLETITVHGTKPKFVIYDPLTGNKIDCFFPEELLDEVKQALPSRVRVSGTAKYNKQGYPISIIVETFKPLRSREQLPSFKDLEGINFSGSLDPTEYIRRLRNG